MKLAKSTKNSKVFWKFCKKKERNLYFFDTTPLKSFSNIEHFSNNLRNHAHFGVFPTTDRQGNNIVSVIIHRMHPAALDVDYLGSNLALFGPQTAEICFENGPTLYYKEF